jgi:hypothetical protein
MLLSPARAGRRSLEGRASNASSVGSPAPSSAGGRRLHGKQEAKLGAARPAASPMDWDIHHEMMFQECASIHERFPGLSGLRLMNQINKFYRCQGSECLRHSSVGLG